jgi:hypothetical protein
MAGCNNRYNTNIQRRQQSCLYYTMLAGCNNRYNTNIQRRQQSCLYYTMLAGCNNRYNTNIQRRQQSCLYYTMLFVVELFNSFKLKYIYDNKYFKKRLIK